MPDLVWATFAAGFPFLVAYWTLEKTLEHRGPEAFKDPGGWRLPLGEVLVFGSVPAAIAFVAVIDLVVNT